MCLDSWPGMAAGGDRGGTQWDLAYAGAIQGARRLRGSLDRTLRVNRGGLHLEAGEDYPAQFVAISCCSGPVHVRSGDSRRSSTIRSAPA